jgi:hypothetical protein
MASFTLKPGSSEAYTGRIPAPANPEGAYTADNVTGISIPRTKGTSSSTASKLELLLKQASCPAKPLCLTSLTSAIRSYPRRHKTHG